MHMADALISPTVGGAMWAASIGLGAYSIRKVKSEIDDKKIPLMGVLGAFVFTAQMINFTIPLTGSSGHIGGGLLLAALLGPYAAFITMASILAIQALFFADGGILALGCNIFNLGFYPCFLAYPFIYKALLRKNSSSIYFYAITIIASIVGLQLGSLSVVTETFLSNRTALPFQHFLMLMQPIHLAIGIIEGTITAAVLRFIWIARPEILDIKDRSSFSKNKILVAFLAVSLVTGSLFSWFASSKPDGLEWSLSSVEFEEEQDPKGVYVFLSDIQNKLSFLPDYTLRESHIQSSDIEMWPNIDTGRSISGLVGGTLTLMTVAFIGVIIYLFRRRKNPVSIISDS